MAGAPYDHDPGGNVAPGCEPFGYEPDNDVDLDDYTTWHDTFAEP